MQLAAPSESGCGKIGNAVVVDLQSANDRPAAARDGLHDVALLPGAGSCVNTLQTLLNNKGASLAVDGDFGPATLAAVKSFQSSKGLEVRIMESRCVVPMFCVLMMAVYNSVHPAELVTSMHECTHCGCNDVTSGCFVPRSMASSVLERKMPCTEALPPALPLRPPLANLPRF